MTQSINSGKAPGIDSVFRDNAAQQADKANVSNLFNTMIAMQAGPTSHPKPAPDPVRELQGVITSLCSQVGTIKGKMDSLRLNTTFDQNVQKTLLQAQNKLKNTGGVKENAPLKGLPDFPQGPDVSKREKMEFVMKMLQDNPKATRKQLEAKYTYTDPGKPGVKTGPLSFAGGGQGNVIFLRDTNVVIKKELIKPEADTYRFFRDFDAFCKSKGKTVPKGLKGFSPKNLKNMYAARDVILKGFPVPLAMKDDGKNVIVAVKNSTYDGNVKVGNTVDDIKIGARIVSKHELRAHGSKQGSGPRWLLKVVKTKIFPAMKGTPGRGYEFVAQDNSTMARLKGGYRTDTILSRKFDALTKEQKLSLHTQLLGIMDAHQILPVTFVGSSVMMSLPDDKIKMPHICMGDFAHAMFTSELKESGSTGTLKERIYEKYKDNFDEGINNLAKLLEKSLKKDGVIVV